MPLWTLLCALGLSHAGTEKGCSHNVGSMQLYKMPLYVEDFLSLELSGLGQTPFSHFDHMVISSIFKMLHAHMVHKVLSILYPHLFSEWHYTDTQELFGMVFMRSIVGSLWGPVEIFRETCLCLFILLLSLRDADGIGTIQRATWVKFLERQQASLIPWLIEGLVCVCEDASSSGLKDWPCCHWNQQRWVMWFKNAEKSVFSNMI